MWMPVPKLLVFDRYCSDGAVLPVLSCVFSEQDSVDKQKNKTGARAVGGLVGDGDTMLHFSHETRLHVHAYIPGCGKGEEKKGGRGEFKLPPK